MVDFSRALLTILWTIGLHLSFILCPILAVRNTHNHHLLHGGHSITLSDNVDDQRLNWRNQSVYMANIFVKIYGHENELVYTESVASMGGLRQLYDSNNWCYPWAPFAIVLHGWRESCETKWVPQLVKKLRIHRGGCIICMDYSHYSRDVYHRLVRNFHPIANTLIMVLYNLAEIGLRMELGYIFGFSFGGQLATEAGRRIGFFRLHEIDTCDMAGPGFDHRPQADHRLAAQNVQCIHTSWDKGTHHFHCHQDWRLGNCGFTQPAAGDPPLGSHGLCPYMYINSFDFEFRAVERPMECPSKTPALSFPHDYRMGYLERRKYQVFGELFASTSNNWPYAVNHREHNISIELPEMIDF